MLHMHGAMYQAIWSMLIVLGTCMCVKCNVNYLVAGFEDGSIALFDYKKQLEAITELKVHSEPGNKTIIMLAS